MQSVLRQSPYSLEYNDLVVVKIRARNSIGMAIEFSDENTLGARIQVVPSKMQNVFEGAATDDTRIQINWNSLTGDQTGGTTILSYNLEMQVAGVWIELVGQTTYYKQTLFLIQTNIVSGQSYSFRVRARNKWGYGPFSDADVIEASSKPDRH